MSGCISLSASKELHEKFSCSELRVQVVCSCSMIAALSKKQVVYSLPPKEKLRSLYRKDLREYDQQDCLADEEVLKSKEVICCLIG